MNRTRHFNPSPPANRPGKRNRHYSETCFGFDAMSRRNAVRGPSGTIVRSVFDTRDNAIAVYVGTEDAGATDAQPDGGGGVPGNNMMLVTTNVFDFNNPVGGNNWLTKTIGFIDYTSEFDYDFRNRRTKFLQWIVNASRAAAKRE